MISKHQRVYLLAAIMTVAALGMGTVYASMNEAMLSVPRYGDDCAHGHNGFDCKPAQHITDIDALEKATSELQKRVSSLERYHPSQ